MKNAHGWHAIFMIESCDAGSLPFKGDFNKFLEGASGYNHVTNASTSFFESKVVSGFNDKAKAGITVPNYPQYRDMNQMFIDMIDGLTKVNGGYAETDTLTLKAEQGLIPEIQAIKNHSKKITENLGQPFKLRTCITGPYTLSFLLAYKDKNTFTRLGNVLAKITEANTFNTKHGTVKLVSVDEPVFGFVDDPLLDHGSEGRENLLKAWQTIMQKTRAKGAQTCLHLHNTTDELFWQVKSLSIIESHVCDPFYQAERTKEQLEATDKSLKASIAVTDFDQLIRKHITTEAGKLNEIAVNEKVAEVWKNLKTRKVNPAAFLDTVDVMKQRLTQALEKFGDNRILYAGTECGTWGFPTYESAIEYLGRVSKAVHTHTATTPNAT
jgi:5-methyltetrahydropteroyltriglutamate--homocysteine methyltransferase